MAIRNPGPLLGGSMAGIKSRQIIGKVMNTTAGGVYTTDATIPVAVDMARAVCFPLSAMGDVATGAYTTCSAYVYSPTVLRVIYKSNGVITPTFNWMVVEFAEPPRSIQYFTGASTPITLSPALINTSKAIMWCTQVRIWLTDGHVLPTIASTSQVTLNTTGTATGALIWYLVEFN